MQHLHSLLQATPDRPTCLTIGGFDGVHRGHQRVIKQLLAQASAKDLRPAALTFFPLPRQVLRPPQPRYYLTSPEKRARLLHDLGIELVITHPFTLETSAIRAADFVDLLVAHLNIREIWVGPDFALGYQRKGDVDFMRQQGAEKGFEVNTVDFYRASDTIISSSRIRQLVREGAVQEAQHLLGRPYRLPGRVVLGDQRGRLLGFPTANLETWEEQILPGNGIYAGLAILETGQVPAAINIGKRPTVTAGIRQTVEAHLLDFNDDLYGQEIALDFVARIRNEKQFSSPAELSAQVAQDVADTRRILG